MTRATSRHARPIADAAEPLVHRVVPELLRRAVRVLVVGCGGTGSEIASGLVFLHQAMRVHGHPYGLDVHLLDGDLVSETNTVRQPFGQGDVGHPKAVILANRINAFYGLRWGAIPRHLSAVDRSMGLARGADLVIGCVDSRQARATIREAVEAQRVAYWLDLGNDASTGQFILGQPPLDAMQPMRADRLPTAAELYPEIVHAAADAGDDRPSCSAVEALTRQEPFVNRVLAAQALAMLARLFRYGELAYHGGFINLATGRMTALPVSPEHWARIVAPSAAPGPQRPRRAAAMHPARVVRRRAA